jgi:hypothetical protein
MKMNTPFIEVPANKKSLAKRKLVYGVGVNDADYMVGQPVSGKLVLCPFYRVWTHILERCYSDKYHARHPTYIGCSVSKEWLLFSNFKKWMEGQNWKGMELDKDILFKGNKSYSPENCSFITAQLNTFFNDCRKNKQNHLVGAYLIEQNKKYRSYCNNPFAGKLECLGTFSTELEAHLTWKMRKHEHALTYADLQDDERIAAALRARYAD